MTLDRRNKATEFSIICEISTLFLYLYLTEKKQTHIRKVKLSFEAVRVRY